MRLTLLFILIFAISCGPGAREGIQSVTLGAVGNEPTNVGDTYVHIISNQNDLELIMTPIFDSASVCTIAGPSSLACTNNLCTFTCNDENCAGEYTVMCEGDTKTFRVIPVQQNPAEVFNISGNLLEPDSWSSAQKLAVLDGAGSTTLEIGKVNYLGNVAPPRDTCLPESTIGNEPVNLPNFIDYRSQDDSTAGTTITHDFQGQGGTLSLTRVCTGSDNIERRVVQRGRENEATQDPRAKAQIVVLNQRAQAEATLHTGVAAAPARFTDNSRFDYGLTLDFNWSISGVEKCLVVLSASEMPSEQALSASVLDAENEAGQVQAMQPEFSADIHLQCTVNEVIVPALTAFELPGGQGDAPYNVRVQVRVDDFALTTNRSGVVLVQSLNVEPASTASCKLRENSTTTNEPVEAGSDLSAGSNGSVESFGVECDAPLLMNSNITPVEEEEVVFWGDFIASDESVQTSLPAGVEIVAGNVTIGRAGVDDGSLNTLREVGGDYLYDTGTNNLNDHSSNVVIVHGDLTLENSLVSGYFFNNLVEVRGSLSVTSNTLMAELDFPRLVRVGVIPMPGNDLQVTGNNSLGSIAMTALVSVANNLTVQQNNSLAAITLGGPISTNNAIVGDNDMTCQQLEDTVSSPIVGNTETYRNAANALCGGISF